MSNDCPYCGYIDITLQRHWLCQSTWTRPRELSEVLSSDTFVSPRCPLSFYDYLSHCCLSFDISSVTRSVDTIMSNATGVAVGVSMTLVIVLVAGATGFMYTRRRKRVMDLGRPGVRGSVVLERSHPASHVTPFAAGYEGPCFGTYHRLVQAMRS